MSKQTIRNQKALSLATEAERVLSSDPRRSLSLLEEACRLSPEKPVCWVRKEMQNTP